MEYGRRNATGLANQGWKDSRFRHYGFGNHFGKLCRREPLEKQSMSTAENLITRKLRRGGVARSPLPDTDMIGETFARLIEHRLRPMVKTMIGAMVTECRVIKLSEALQTISVPAMLGVVEVEDADTQGLLNVDTDLAYHLIDLMLGGDPAAAPIPTTRTFTSIDMAVCRLPLEEFVAAFGEAVASCLGRPLTKRISIRDQRQNVSQIQVAPDYVDVLVLSIMLDIGEAARTGSLDLMLPLAALDTILAAFKEKSGEAARDRPDDLWKVQMRHTAATSPVKVSAVLHRQPLTVAALQSLQAGDVLEIPATAPDEVELSIAQPNGRTARVAVGRLGTYRGSKVVKLETNVDPRIREHIKRAL